MSASDPDEGILLDNAPSTAPTTPEGSLSFSPVLRAMGDGNLDIESSSLALQALGLRSLTSAPIHTGPRHVSNICCVGAGYVGQFV